MLCPSDVAFNRNFVSQEGTVVRYNISINDGIKYLWGARLYVIEHKYHRDPATMRDD